MSEYKKLGLPWEYSITSYTRLFKNTGAPDAFARGDPQYVAGFWNVKECAFALRATNVHHELVEALKAITDSFPRDDTWWCPHCGPTDCRYDGRCEQCGFTIEDLAPESLIEQAEAAITKAEPEEDAE